MADLGLGFVKDIVKTGMVIKEALETFQENEEDCQDLQKLVATLTSILSVLQVMGSSHPMMPPGTLVGLQGSLNRGLNLVTKWQKRNGMRRFLMSRYLAKQLRRVNDDIQMNMNLGCFAMVASISVEWTIITTRYGGAPPPPTKPQDAAEMEIHSSHSTAGGTGGRSFEYKDEIITTVTAGTEAPYSPSSSASEFSFSETVATHHVSEESTNGEKEYITVTKRRIVIKVQMPSNKTRHKALKLLSRACGVHSLGITGDARDNIEVVGEGLDCVALVSALRRHNFGHAMILQVEVCPANKTASDLNKDLDSEWDSDFTVYDSVIEETASDLHKDSDSGQDPNLKVHNSGVEETASDLQKDLDPGQDLDFTEGVSDDDLMQDADKAEVSPYTRDVRGWVFHHYIMLGVCFMIAFASIISLLCFR